MIVVAWIFLSILVGAMGASRRIGFGWAFFGAILLSPLIGVVLVFNSTKLRDIERDNIAMDAQEFSNWLIQRKENPKEIPELIGTQLMVHFEITNPMLRGRPVRISGFRKKTGELAKSGDKVVVLRCYGKQYFVQSPYQGVVKHFSKIGDFLAEGEPLFIIDPIDTF